MMTLLKRRDFLKMLAAGLLGGSMAPEVMAREEILWTNPRTRKVDDSIKDYLHKMKNFDKPYKEDIRVSREEYKTFTETVKRLRRLEAFVGHGNFQHLNFDGAVSFAHNYSDIGPFTQKEIAFLENIFYVDASIYGFSGRKPLQDITDRINKKDMVKVPHSGTYLHRGDSLEIFSQLRKKVGEELILTSGIRGVMKQFLLFLNKAYNNDGNLSLSSRSLAPPGYSFHGIGDFDVGERGLGIGNFTERFAATGVYHKLVDLGYLTLRYPQGNMLGVRYEPWHIEISGA
jgi:hypothetical protein